MNSEAGITYRWINFWEATPAEVAQIDAITRQHKWMKFNLNTTRLCVAEHHGRIIAFSAFQMTPYVGPLYVNKYYRGYGVAEKLADDTMEFLQGIEARGWLVIADSPFTERICEDRKMTKVESPVYVYNAEVFTEERKELVAISEASSI